jgi:hypothetical protein
MISKSEARHKYYLDMLVESLEDIDESRQDASWIMKEGIWYRPHSLDKEKLCDLIVVYKLYAVPIELKGSIHQEHKAGVQIRYGKRFIEQELKMTAPYGKIVIFDHGRYETHKKNFIPSDTIEHQVTKTNDVCTFKRLGVPYGNNTHRR